MSGWCQALVPGPEWETPPSPAGQVDVVASAGHGRLVHPGSGRAPTPYSPSRGWTSYPVPGTQGHSPTRSVPVTGSRLLPEAPRDQVRPTRRGESALLCRSETEPKTFPPERLLGTPDSRPVGPALVSIVSTRTGTLSCILLQRPPHLVPGSGRSAREAHLRSTMFLPRDDW